MKVHVGDVLVWNAGEIGLHFGFRTDADEHGAGVGVVDSDPNRRKVAVGPPIIAAWLTEVDLVRGQREAVRLEPLVGCREETGIVALGTVRPTEAGPRSQKSESDHRDDRPQDKQNDTWWFH